MARKFVCAGNKNDEEDFPGTRNDKFLLKHCWGAQEKTGRQGVAAEIEDSGLDSRESRPPEFYHLACLLYRGVSAVGYPALTLWV